MGTYFIPIVHYVAMLSIGEIMKLIAAWLRAAFCFKKGNLFHDYSFRQQELGIGRTFPKFLTQWYECANCNRIERAVNYNLGVANDAD
jgi:hypothetical protein